MAIDVSPNFTVALRGYDKDQVDHYLESMSEHTSETDDQLYDLQEQNRYLEGEREQLLSRIEELEDAIRSETPHSIAALGQRITLILAEAEEGASDTVSQAEAKAKYLVDAAHKEADAIHKQAEMLGAQANETLASAQRQAEALAERLESEARSRAASIVGDAQMRAQRRHDQIEGWAQEVIARTQAEQARMADEFAEVRRRHEANLQALLGDRDDAIAALRSLQGSLVRAISRVHVESQSAPALEAAARRHGGEIEAATLERTDADELQAEDVDTVAEQGEDAEAEAQAEVMDHGEETVAVERPDADEIANAS